MDMMKIMKNKLILLIVTMIILLIIIKKMNDNITQANTIKTIQKWKMIIIIVLSNQLFHLIFFKHGIQRI